MNKYEPRVIRPQRYVRNSGLRGDDFAETIRLDLGDKLVAWTLVLAAIVILVVSFSEWM